MSDDNRILLRALPGFQQIDSDALEEFASACVLRRFRAGTRLLDDPARAAGLYLLAAGYVAVELGQGRAAVRVARVGPGETFGSVDLGEGADPTTAVFADTDVVALELPQWRLREILETTSYDVAGPLRRALIISLLRRIRVREQRLARLEIDHGTALPPGVRQQLIEATNPPDSRRTPQPQPPPTGGHGGGI